MKTARSTVAKRHIQDLLHKSSSALSQPELQDLSVGICDRVTIYRVLERLVEEGGAHRTVDMDGTVRYAACHDCDHDHKHAHHHLHFSCEECGSVTCLEDVVPEFRLPRKYKMHEVNFTVSGICSQCNV